MTTREFIGWQLYFKNKGPDIQEIQLAVLSTIVSNGLGGKRKVGDFLITNEREKHIPKNQKGMSETSVRAAFAGIATPMK